MIKMTQKKLLALAIVSTIGLSASSAFAQASNDIVVDGTGIIPYAIDSRKVVVRSGTNLCWRTGFWTPAAAEQVKAGKFPVGCSCDPEVVPADKCQEVATAPEAAPVPTSDKIKLSADALFDFDKATLKPEGKIKLRDIAQNAKNINLEVILATGHTDRIGKDAYNQSLSERRASAVKTFIVAQGIDPSRVYTEGKGKTQPVTGDKCDHIKGRTALISCLQPDRRVEVEVIGTKN